MYFDFFCGENIWSSFLTRVEAVRTDLLGSSVKPFSIHLCRSFTLVSCVSRREAAQQSGNHFTNHPINQCFGLPAAQPVTPSAPDWENQSVSQSVSQPRTPSPGDSLSFPRSRDRGCSLLPRLQKSILAALPAPLCVTLYRLDHVSVVSAVKAAMLPRSHMPNPSSQSYQKSYSLTQSSEISSQLESSSVKTHWG